MNVLLMYGTDYMDTMCIYTKCKNTKFYLDVDIAYKLELNLQSLFPSAFRLEGFHVMNPPESISLCGRTTLPPPPISDVIMVSQITEKGLRARTRQGAGTREEEDSK